MKDYGEAYVTLRTAKLLKKLYFECVPCRFYYQEDGNVCQPKTKGAAYPAPTLAQVMRFLREKYLIEVMPVPYRYPSKWICFLVYLGQSKEGDDKYDMCEISKQYTSYEKAAENGVRIVLKDIVSAIERKRKKQSVAT